MADEFDEFEQYLRQFQPRKPARPLHVPRPAWRTTPARLAAAAVLLAALAAALIWLNHATVSVDVMESTMRIGAESRASGSSVTAARLTRTVLASSPDAEDALAAAAQEVLLRVERAEGPLSVLARD